MGGKEGPKADRPASQAAPSAANGERLGLRQGGRGEGARWITCRHKTTGQRSWRRDAGSERVRAEERIGRGRLGRSATSPIR